jgi:hypothetical protein
MMGYWRPKKRRYFHRAACQGKTTVGKYFGRGFRPAGWVLYRIQKRSDVSEIRFLIPHQNDWNFCLIPSAMPVTPSRETTSGSRSPSSNTAAVNGFVFDKPWKLETVKKSRRPPKQARVKRQIFSFEIQTF